MFSSVDNIIMQLSVDNDDDRTLSNISRLTNETRERCIAPSLEEYLRPGSHLQYFPRPEWLTQIDRKVPNNAEKSDESPRAVVDVRIQENIRVPESDELGSDMAWRNGQISMLSPIFGLVMPELQAAPSHTRNRSPLFRRSSQAHSGDTAASFADTIIFGAPDTVADAVDSSRIQEKVDELCLRRNISCFNEPILFGKDNNSALHVAIREGCTQAALTLIQMGSDVNLQNSKGITPIILSSQRGNFEVTRSLFLHGANLNMTSRNGTSSLIQASHFGHIEIVRWLLKHGALQNQTNSKHTTALMRGSQEGHKAVVEILLRYGADPNKTNKDELSALMLAAQRGHVEIIKILLRCGAKLDICTSQHSTALMLATKRGNVNVARVLIQNGCDLEVKDSRGRTARDIATKLGSKQLIDLISLDTQLFLMKRNVAIERNYEVVKLWTLLHLERATFAASKLDHSGCRQRLIVNEMQPHDIAPTNVHNEIILRTMLLPLSLVGHISGYLCLPMLYEKRLEMMTRRCLLNPNSTISNALDLIDDVLEEIGFVVACDAAAITAPQGFESWAGWNSNRKYGVQPDSRKCDENREEWIEREHFALKQKRDACFLQILAYRTSKLKSKLSTEFNVPDAILQKLEYNSDIASLTRRMGSHSVHFDASVASDIVQLAGALVLWYRSRK